MEEIVRSIVGAVLLASSSANAQSAPAKTSLAGTNWNSNAKLLSDGYYSMCHISSIEFWTDGTARLTFDDQGTTDMDDGTWTLNGTNLTIGYVDPIRSNNVDRFADERLAGTYSNGKLELAHSWKNFDGSAQSESCTFSIEAKAPQPKPRRRSRH